MAEKLLACPSSKRTSKRLSSYDRTAMELNNVYRVVEKGIKRVFITKKSTI